MFDSAKYTREHKVERALALQRFHQKRPFYKTWSNMVQRCHNTGATKYKNYGGRGIIVCEEWRNNYQAWYDYVSKLPHFGEEGRTQDRINNDRDYEPNNIRWATRKEQGSNMRRRSGGVKGERHGHAKLTEAQVIEIRGLYPALTVVEIAEKFGVSPQTIYYILQRKSWKHVL